MPEYHSSRRKSSETKGNTSDTVFHTFVVILAAADRAEYLTIAEVSCLILYVQHTTSKSGKTIKGGFFISEWTNLIGAAGLSVAYEGLKARRILAEVPLPEDIDYMGGGAGIGLHLELLDRL